MCISVPLSYNWQIHISCIETPHINSSAADKIDKTVCVTVSDSCAEAYSNLASFTHQLKLFQTG